jgi:type II secretory pathway pseudopilin PulG
MTNTPVTEQKGFTLVEVTIILLVLVILSTILLPNLGDFNRMARFVRVKEDLGALCASLSQYVVDTGELAFWQWGGRDGGGIGSDTPDRTSPVGLLIGDGDTPGISGSIDGENWVLSQFEAFAEPTDIDALDVQFRVDTFGNHLIHNTPLGNTTAGHRLPSDMLNGALSSGIPGGLLFDSADGQGFNSQFAWRGPYISDRVDPDPWGNRYMANVFGMYVPADATADGYGTAVVCYSAGADETVDTNFNQPGGWFTGDDDYVALVTAGGGR